MMMQTEKKQQQRVVWILPTQHMMALSPEHILDLLLNVPSLPPEKLRCDQVPKKPACGTIYALLKAEEEPLEDDEYSWNEREMKYKVNVRNYVRYIFISFF